MIERFVGGIIGRTCLQYVPYHACAAAFERPA